MEFSKGERSIKTRNTSMNLKVKKNRVGKIEKIT
jgi:hypothetical protein